MAENKVKAIDLLFTRKTIFEYINVNEADTERTEDNGTWEQRRVKDDTLQLHQG